EEPRQRAMQTLAVVEPTLHEVDDVRDRLGRFGRIGLEFERTLRRLDDDHRRPALRHERRGREETETAEKTNDADRPSFDRPRMSPGHELVERLRLNARGERVEP